MEFTKTTEESPHGSNEIKSPTFGKAYFLHVLAKPFIEKLFLSKASESNGKHTMYILVSLYFEHKYVLLS